MTVVHTFHALAFIENFSLKELAPHYPEAKRVHQQLFYPAAAGGVVFLFSFGVVIFFDVGQAGREGELLRLRRAPSVIRDAQVISEEFTVREQSGARPDVEDGVLVVDTLSPERTSMVALRHHRKCIRMNDCGTPGPPRCVGPRSTRTTRAPPRNTRTATQTSTSSAHAPEQRLLPSLAHRAGRRPALGQPGARSAEREDARIPTTPPARGTTSAKNLRSRTRGTVT